MSARPWMPFYFGDYLADTGHLSTLEHGAYLLLIAHYWQKGGLPTEDGQLARIARLTAAQWRKAKPVLQAFFSDGWKHKRIEFELTEAARISEAGRKGGMASAESRRAAKTQQYQLSEPTTVERPLNDHGNDPGTIRQALQPQPQSPKKEENKEPSLRSVRASVPPETLNPDWPADSFEQFYSAYPRKTGRLDAKKAFERVRKTHGVPWPDLMEAVRAYAATADPQFTKHPSTWLNKGCWADENSPGAQNGYRGPGAVQNTRSEIINAADSLIERIKSFDRPIPSAICSGEGAPVVRLLPEGRRERPGDVYGGGDGDLGRVSAGGDSTGN